jgi:hypothetical protein
LADYELWGEVIEEGMRLNAADLIFMKLALPSPMAVY